MWPYIGKINSILYDLYYVYVLYHLCRCSECMRTCVVGERDRVLTPVCLWMLCITILIHNRIGNVWKNIICYSQEWKTSSSIKMVPIEGSADASVLYSSMKPCCADHQLGMQCVSVMTTDRAAVMTGSDRLHKGKYTWVGILFQNCIMQQKYIKRVNAWAEGLSLIIYAFSSKQQVSQYQKSSLKKSASARQVSSIILQTGLYRLGR